MSDGTPGNATMVADINPGDASSCGGGMVDLGGVLLFAAQDPTYGLELWRSDGTPGGTYIVKDINTGALGSNPSGMYVHDGFAYFSARVPGVGEELVRTDGTGAGTMMIKDMNPGPDDSNPHHFTASGGTLFFIASDGVTPYELFKTDGTDVGTVLVKDINPGSNGSSPAALTDFDGTLFFSAYTPSGTELWKSDGTSAGTVQVKDIWSGSGSSNPSALTVSGATLVFAAKTSASGTELWKSDGTDAGTVQVKDINPGSGHSYPQDLVDNDGTVYFSAEDAGGVRRLFSSDGTDPGTEMIDLGQAEYSSSPSYLAALADRVLFSAWEASTGWELWASDGTAAGTSLVADINPGAGDGMPGFLVANDSVVVFRANDGIHGSELWASDGTPGGTSMVVDIRAGATGSNPGRPVRLGSSFVFSAFDGSAANPWISDGTPGGTAKLSVSCGNANNFYSSNGTVYFSCWDSTYGTEPWKTDGTPAGTVRLKDLVPGPSSSNPRGFGAAAGTVFFQATTSAEGAELWKTDGTTAGTGLVLDLYPAGSSSPGGFTDVGGTAFFKAQDGDGSELWRSDGTAMGTSQVIDLVPGGGYSYPAYLTEFGGNLIMIANDAVTGGELWISDGTAPGTTQIVDLDSGGDGTPLTLQVDGFTHFNGSLWLAASDGLSGLELWKTDGTAVGTAQPMDVNPGADSSSPDGWVVAGGRLFFAADDGAHGRELWTAYVAADLSVTKDDGVEWVLPGQTTTYTMVVGNAGPSDEPAARVVDSFPAGLSCTWTCSGSGGATCAAGPVTGGLDDIAGLPAGSSATYSAECVVLASSGVIDNTVTVETSVDVTDPDPTDNSDTDSNTVVEADFGDAPDPTYPTLRASAGAGHLVGSGLFLGVSVDSELDGQPTAGADGDDTGGSDDEDGVLFTSGLGVGLDATVDVNSTGAGFLNVWIDFNGDGDWTDTGEQIFTDQTVVAGINSMSFPVPVGATLGTSYARFRLDTNGGLAPNGYATDGEVEDYMVEIVEGPDLEIGMTASSEPSPSGRPLTYTITVTNNGPLPATSVTVTDTLPGELTFVSSTPGAPDCTFAADTLTCDLGTMAPTDSAQITIETVLDHPVWGSFSNTASVSADETDPIPGNNTATIDTIIGVFVDGFETGDTGRWSDTAP